MQLSQASAEKIIKDLGMDDMPLVAVRPAPHQVPADWFQRYRAARHRFMQSLTDSVEELAFMNLSQDEFMALVTGAALPNNMSVRMRTPMAWGGEISPENMFMCATFPHSQNIDRFIIGQTGYDTVWLPAPAKKIYIPAHTGGGGDGGNATEDRLSQIAAQIASGRGLE